MLATLTIASLAVQFATLTGVPPLDTAVFADSSIELCVRSSSIDPLVDRFYESRGALFHVASRDVLAEVQALLQDVQYAVPALHLTLGALCDEPNASACACDVVVGASDALPENVLATAQQHGSGAVVEWADIVFSLKHCWYTHTPVCAFAREVHRHPLLPLGVTIVVVLSLGPALVWLGWMACQSGSFASAMRSTSPLAVVAVLFMLSFGPYVAWAVFVPCVECHDFRATLAHELGHALSLGHPDELPTWTAGTCDGTWTPAAAAAALFASEPLVISDAETAPLMTSISHHREHTCLRESDQRGLDQLYARPGDACSISAACDERWNPLAAYRIAVLALMLLGGSGVVVVVVRACDRWWASPRAAAPKDAHDGLWLTQAL